VSGLLLQIGGALLAALLALVGVFKVQRDNARKGRQEAETAVKTHEARSEQRKKADTVLKDSEEATHEAVDKAREDARSGRRDHFASGMRDNDD